MKRNEAPMEWQTIFQAIGHPAILLDPQLKAIFVSGYTEDIISREGLLEQGINFVQKPVTPSALLNKVREILDA